MIQVNLSVNYVCRKQRKNKVLPWTSCGASATVMALKASGWPVPSPKGVRPEDHLTGILLSPDAKERRAAIPGNWADDIPPNQIHAVLAWGINRWLGKRVVQFKENGTLRDVVSHLYHRTALVMNGLFAGLDHNIAVVGFDTAQEEHEFRGGIDLDRVTDIIIDDPWGDYHTSYKDQNGNDVHVTVEEFDRITHKANGPKWMHVFERGPLS